MEDSFNYKNTLINFVHSSLDNLISKGIFKNRTIVFYGITEAHNVAIRYLKENNYTVEAIVDNNPARMKLANDGIKIMRPSDLLTPFDPEFAVLIGGNYYNEMAKQLEGWGYIKGIHIFRIFNPDEAISSIVNPDYKKISIDEEKKIQLNALRFLKSKCKEARINYYLAYGTLIGAVRHNGFIPWDNDIDVYMFERDVTRLYDVIKENDEYELLLPGVTRNYLQLTPLLVSKNTVTYRVDFPFVCSTGVGIDIMPLVNLGNDREEATLFLNNSYALIKVFKDRLLKSNSFDECLPELENCLKYSKKKEQKPSEYVGVMYGQTYGLKNIYKNEWFEPEEGIFENESFTIPMGYHQLLSQVYGDYMRLPPESERNAQNHPWQNYWKIRE